MSTPANDRRRAVSPAPVLSLAPRTRSLEEAFISLTAVQS